MPSCLRFAGATPALLQDSQRRLPHAVDAAGLGLGRRSLQCLFSFVALYLLTGSIMARAGQFLAAPQYATGSFPVSMTLGDFNGD
jgi:hypothetical protein